jgi:hypothetical protein
MKHKLQQVFILFFLSLLIICIETKGQVANSWIDYNKTYWKLAISTNGIVKIDKAQLDAIGFPTSSATGNTIFVINNGKEIPIYVSTNALFNTTDYITFEGKMNTGSFDKELYISSDKHINPYRSIINDTSFYFLSYDDTRINKRLDRKPAAITFSSTSLTHCKATVYDTQNTASMPGKDLSPGSTITSETLHSSQFDNGEGYYIAGWGGAGNTGSVSIQTPEFMNIGNFNLHMCHTIEDKKSMAKPISFSINNNDFYNYNATTTGSENIQLNIPSSQLLANNQIKVNVDISSAPPSHRINFIVIEYPHTWNFESKDYFEFIAPANTSNHSITITNFNHGGIAPDLYDLSNNVVLQGFIDGSNNVKYELDPSSLERKMILISNNSSRNLKAEFKGTRKFTDYTALSNQGNYAIVADAKLSEPLDGVNVIEAYNQYRKSPQGGNYKSIVVDIDELYEQYAYGIRRHPLSIVNFIDDATKNWSTKLEYIYFIGKGINYINFKSINDLSKNFEGLVPTFGFPGSDMAFAFDKSTWRNKLSIGRLNVWNRNEIQTYLQKIKSYEAALVPTTIPDPESELWKKRVLHIAGGDGSSPNLQATTLLPTLNSAKNQLEGAYIGAAVTTVAKNTKGLPTTIEDKTVDSLINSGISLITYYGHGSAYSMDYNLKNPNLHNTAPKIPLYIALGCEIAAIYGLNNEKTISENYLLAPNSGSMITLASNNLGWTNHHTKFMYILYHMIGKEKYGMTIGKQVAAAQDSFMKASFSTTPNVTTIEQAHMESLILQGDPAIRFAMFAEKPDYYIGNNYISTIPSSVTTTIDTFELKIQAFNLGKANSDSVVLKVEQTNPEGKLVLNQLRTIYNFNTSAEVIIKVPINKTKDFGINKFKIMIDADNKYDEISELNNSLNMDIFIMSDDIVPVHPYNYSIVYQPSLTLKASTLNPFAPKSKYKIEIDTTELFNSPSKLSTTIESSGGILKWSPSITMNDSMVYYWRTAKDTTNPTWHNSSFIYLQHGSDGWNQSHFYQYNYNALDSLDYETDRLFRFSKTEMKITDKNTIMWLPSPPYTQYSNSASNRVVSGSEELQLYECDFNGTIMIMVFDSLSGKPWFNNSVGAPGRFGSNAICRASSAQSFSYPLYTAAGRNAAKDFIESIPDGNYILIRNNISWNNWGGYYINTWQNDTLINGSGNSLYHTIKNVGFSEIDSFYQPRVFSFFRKKGKLDYPIQQHVPENINDVLIVDYSFPASGVAGRMNSVVIGPVEKWNTLLWKTSTVLDTVLSSDSVRVVINGITPSGTITKLYDSTEFSVDLGFIDAKNYPKLSLQWFSKDQINKTSAQLDYWRILYDPLPEAALAPNLHLSFNDSVQSGQMIDLSIAIENLTHKSMDSMLVRYKVIDRNGINHDLQTIRYNKLNGSDSIHANLTFDPKAFPSKNYLFIEANPNNDQPEQYHPNNLGYLPFGVQVDEHPPVIDVTFDGMHILDRDIVSSKPFIKVLLRDENLIKALNDTSTLKLFMKYPSDPAGTKRKINFDGSVCKFVSADVSKGKNEAFIEYKPEFIEDGIYQLFVSGNDMTGNEAGKGNEYTISFEVINKSTITNLLNYPNPFSTSTAFVFTLTGSQIPSQFKIQILSVTGKVVREITKQELGPIHIGRNVTEYKWDGKDQFGQLLGNGVYLYRVVTTINGEQVEKRANTAIDKFYKNGYSKMYIMR